MCACVCVCTCLWGEGACIPEPLRTTDEDDGGTLRLFGMWLRSMFCKLALVISVFKALSTELFTTDRARCQEMLKPPLSFVWHAGLCYICGVCLMVILGISFVAKWDSLLKHLSII